MGKERPQEFHESTTENLKHRQGSWNLSWTSLGNDVISRHFTRRASLPSAQPQHQFELLPQLPSMPSRD